MAVYSADFGTHARASLVQVGSASSRSICCIIARSIPWYKGCGMDLGGASAGPRPRTDESGGLSFRTLSLE